MPPRIGSIASTTRETPSAPVSAKETVTMVPPVDAGISVGCAVRMAPLTQSNRR